MVPTIFPSATYRLVPANQRLLLFYPSQSCAKIKPHFVAKTADKLSLLESKL